MEHIIGVKCTYLCVMELCPICAAVKGEHMFGLICVFGCVFEWVLMCLLVNIWPITSRADMDDRLLSDPMLRNVQLGYNKCPIKPLCWIKGNLLKRCLCLAVMNPESLQPVLLPDKISNNKLWPAFTHSIQYYFTSVWIFMFFCTFSAPIYGFRLNIRVHLCLSSLVITKTSGGSPQRNINTQVLDRHV